jgi:hypothetical protein
VEHEEAWEAFKEEVKKKAELIAESPVSQELE